MLKTDTHVSLDSEADNSVAAVIMAGINADMILPDTMKNYSSVITLCTSPNPPLQMAATAAAVAAQEPPLLVNHRGLLFAQQLHLLMLMMQHTTHTLCCWLQVVHCPVLLTLTLRQQVSNTGGCMQYSQLCAFAPLQA